MPVPYQKLYPHPAERIYTLKDAAEDQMLIEVRCNLCHRMVRFLAEDLARVLGGNLPALRAPFPCSKCGRDSYVATTMRSPRVGDYGHLTVRRPTVVKVIQLWRTVTLGDEV